MACPWRSSSSTSTTSGGQRRVRRRGRRRAPTGPAHAIRAMGAGSTSPTALAATNSRSPARLARRARSSSPSACARNAGRRRRRRPFTTMPASPRRRPALEGRADPRGDLALIGAKRIHQDVVIYGPDLAPGAEGDADEDDPTRASWPGAARAVDAEDAYTRSHCQTVSQLCGLIGAELGLDGARLMRLRLASLLHDVARSASPMRILNSPRSSPPASTSTWSATRCWATTSSRPPTWSSRPAGCAITISASTAAVIPMGSPAIRSAPVARHLVADAFEAMTSNWPYRRAPRRPSRFASWAAMPDAVRPDGRRGHARVLCPHRRRRGRPHPRALGGLKLSAGRGLASGPVHPRFRLLPARRGCWQISMDLAQSSRSGASSRMCAGAT